MRIYENCELGFRKWGSYVESKLLKPDAVNSAQHSAFG